MGCGRGPHLQLRVGLRRVRLGRLVVHGEGDGLHDLGGGGLVHPGEAGHLPRVGRRGRRVG